MPKPQSLASRLGRALRYLLINGLVMYLGYIAHFKHVAWADNLFSFLVVLFSLLSFACLSKDLREAQWAVGRSMPAWIDVTYDLVMICGLAACGHYWLASAWVWIAISSSILFTRPTK